MPERQPQPYTMHGLSLDTWERKRERVYAAIARASEPPTLGELTLACQPGVSPYHVRAALVEMIDLGWIRAVLAGPVAPERAVARYAIARVTATREDD